MYIKKKKRIFEHLYNPYHLIKNLFTQNILHQLLTTFMYLHDVRLFSPVAAPHPFLTKSAISRNLPLYEPPYEPGPGQSFILL